MSRSTQIIGLTKAAEDFLDDNAQLKPTCTCDKCGHTHGGGLMRRVYDKETGRRHGMFDDGPDLEEYTLKDGTKVREVVQLCPWSSGPCILLCLEDENGKRMFEWVEDESVGNEEVDYVTGRYWV